MSNSKNLLSPAMLRAETARRLWQVIKYDFSESIDSVLTPALNNAEQQAWMSAAIYGCVRLYPRYDIQLMQFLKKPIKPNEGEVKALLILGMHQLSAMKVKQHAALNETVNACKEMEKIWAVKLVNGILRSYQRALSDLKHKTEVTQYAHPKWIIKTLKQDWPNHWRDILEANNLQAPMCLRVNAYQSQAAVALQKLEAAGIAAKLHKDVESAILLDTPVLVEQIPEFFSGLFSVQDAAAQYSAQLLVPNEDQKKTLKVLDACAAPGGKTGHLLERLSDESELVALDVSAKRLELIHDNLQRLGFAKVKNIKIHCADAGDVKAWNTKAKTSPQFDRILLDAPCSATGVIRRHPDIKIRRQLKHVQELNKSQATLLQAMWGALKPGGRLLYATCSVFKSENEEQIKAFVAAHQDAKVIPLNIQEVVDSEFGVQIFPGTLHRDGFFYALLEKNTQAFA